jgi:hypothetical protein
MKERDLSSRMLAVTVNRGGTTAFVQKQQMEHLRLSHIGVATKSLPIRVTGTLIHLSRAYSTCCRFSAILTPFTKTTL